MLALAAIYARVTGGESRLDVLTMGRVSVDLYPEQIGVRLRDVRTFRKFLGGSPTNVAVAAARHGRRSAVITKVGDDPFGQYVRDALHGFGVDDRSRRHAPDAAHAGRLLRDLPARRLPAALLPRAEGARPEIRPTSSTSTRSRGRRSSGRPSPGCRQEPSRARRSPRSRPGGRGGITVLDLDYRPMFWSSREEARALVQRGAAHATVAVGNLEECEIAVGEREPHDAAEALLELGVELAIVKQGPEGRARRARADERGRGAAGRRSRW